VANRQDSGKDESGERCDAAEDPDSRPRDLALIHGVTEDGEGLRVIRRRGEILEAGAVRPLREGKPIQGELVKLRPRPEFPLLCDVDVELPMRALASGGSSERRGEPATAPVSEPIEPASSQARERAGRGPAQVASALYRQNWDAIWAGVGKKDLN
jgi:hypothetical protein